MLIQRGFIRGFFILFAAAFVLQFSLSEVPSTQQPGEGFEIYRGRIEDAADLMVTFPTEEQSQETYDRLESFIEDIELMFDGDIPVDVERIRDYFRYALDVYRRTTLLQWCLYDLTLNQSIRLLPGEGITLTLPSYCLDVDAAGPDVEEFFIPEMITGEEAVWLIPLLKHAARNANDGLPVQELIWNMERGESFRDLPEEQQELLQIVVPDARRRYFKSKFGEMLLERFREKLRERFPIIEDFEEAAERINSRREKGRPVRPDYDAFRMSNGLLLKIESTGDFRLMTLTIVHPRETSDRSQTGNRAGAYNFDRGPLSFLRNLFFAGTGVFPRPSSWGQIDVAGWWKNNRDRVQSSSERAEDLVELIEAYDEKGLQGVEDLAARKGFETGVDFFKAFSQANPEAANIFEDFKKFNTDLRDGNAENENRPNNGNQETFDPIGIKLRSSRPDPPQSEATGGGY